MGMLQQFQAAVVAAIIAGALCGCQAMGTPRSLRAANEAYHAGDYAAAYREASAVAGRSTRDRDDAAYLAGLSARKLGRADDARQYLQQAGRSNVDAVAGPALAELGLLESADGRYAAAAEHLSAAADRLDGQQKALAHFYAGIAQQKLGRTTDARTSFALARAGTADPALREQIEAQRAVTGWTVQVGAYRDADNARKAAAALGGRVRGATPRLVPYRSPTGRSLTLVQIGQFTTHHSARRFQEQLGEGVVVSLSR